MRDDELVLFRRLVGVRLGNLLTGRSARLSAGRVGGGIFSAIWLIVLARSLDQVSFGTVVLVLTLAFLTSMIHDGGQSAALAKSVSLQPEMTRELLFIVLRRRFMLALLSLLFISVIFQQISTASLLNVVLIFPSILSTVGYTTIFAVLRVRGSVKVESRNEFLSRLLMLTVGLMVLPWGLTSYLVIFLYSIADIITFLIVWRMYAHLFRNPSRTDLKHLVRSQLKIRSGLLLAFTNALGLLVSRLDPLLIAALSIDSEVSSFAVGSRFVEFSLIPIGAAVVLSIPRFSTVTNPDGLIAAATQLLVYGAGMALLLQLIATFLPLIVGSQYESAITPLRILSISVLVTSFGALLLAWLTLNRPLLAMCSLSLGLGASVFTHLMFTAELGARGGAISNAVASSVIAVTSLLGVAFVISKQRLS